MLLLQVEILVYLGCRLEPVFGCLYKVMIFETIKTESISEQIELLILNRPEVLNAISSKMAEELKSYFSDSTSKRNLRVVIITGAGEKAFCAGADLKERAGKSDSELEAQRVLFQDFFTSVYKFPLPIIAAVNGIAYGGGCEIALMSDFIIVSNDALFALPEVKLGLIPGLGGTQLMPRRIGMGKAKELIFTGRAISGNEAFEIGLVNYVEEKSKLIEKAVNLGKEIAENAPVSIVEAKRAIDKGFNLPLDEAIVIESNSYKKVSHTEDRKEGIKAFVEKRSPKWIGK